MQIKKFLKLKNLKQYFTPKIQEGFRKAGKEGTWYKQRNILYDDLLELYNKNKPQNYQNNIKFVISPHAGLYYCQRVQASVFSQLDLQKYNSIIILGVCHCFHLKGLGQSPFQTWDGIFINQPLKTIDNVFPKVQAKSCQKEHSIEILIPFISLLMKEQNRILPIIPIYCGSKPTQNEIQQLKQLQKENNSLVVISSDFCHFGYDFDYCPQIENKSYDETIDILNMQAVDAMNKGPQDFYNNIIQTGNTVCGLFSIYTGLSLFDSYTSKLMLYEKSGNISSKFDTSVSYCGIVGF